MNAFWDGFEKRAAEQSSEDKTNKKKYTGRGAVVGGALGAAGGGAMASAMQTLTQPVKRNSKYYKEVLRPRNRKELLKALAIGGAGGAALGGLTGLGIGHAKDKVEKYKHENRHKNYGWFGWEDKRD